MLRVFLLAFLLPGCLGDVVPEYLGCFQEVSNNTRFGLSGFQNSVRGLSANKCNVLCFQKGFLYAATKNGRECYCGDYEGSLPTPSDKSKCNIPCIGEVGVMCGGRKAYSLYSTGIKEEDVDDLEIGCMTDGDDIRLIKQHKIDFTLTNTPQRCVAYCKALGYRHAGVQYAFECYCGEASRLSPIVSGCDIPCVGDETFVCGGNWKINVYSTGITKATPGVLQKGCYKHNATGVLAKKTMLDMSPHRCAAFCFLKSIPFASIYNGIECLCTMTIQPSKQKVKVKECDIECPGDKKQKCGGSTRMVTYTTGSVGATVFGKLLGCYKDESNDLLNGPKLNFRVDNYPGLCISKCMEMGFAFAGLKNTYECHCGNVGPKRTPVRIVPDYDCQQPCPTVQTEYCGAPLFLALYRTGLEHSLGVECDKSYSHVNGKQVCVGTVLFSENFSKLNTSIWEHSVKISGEDYEFVTYTKKKENVFIENGKLVIKPTLVDDEEVAHGTLNLEDCTGLNSDDCYRVARSYNILPPVESGQICTRRSFSFKYGIITVRAKMPKGDWVIPQIWLKPVKEVYGQDYMSGKFVVALSRGNEKLLSPEGNEIGHSALESGFMVSKDPKTNIIKKMTVTMGAEPWSSGFSNISLTWTTDTVLFYLDNNVLGLKTVYTFRERSLREEMGFYGPTLGIWKDGSVLAPFDEEFFLCIGLSVGGMNYFPDSSVSGGNVKPWKDFKVKSMQKFWKAKKHWFPTWSNDTRLEIDSISITAY